MRRAWIEILESYFVRIVGTGSPSVRRAWIEIETARLNQRRNEVALREEGVD